MRRIPCVPECSIRQNGRWKESAYHVSFRKVLFLVGFGVEGKPTVIAPFSFARHDPLSFGSQPKATVRPVWVPASPVEASRSAQAVLPVPVVHSGCSRRFHCRCVVLPIVMTAGLGRMSVCALP